MTNKENPHGALGSNQPLERVPVVEETTPAIEEKEEESVPDAQESTSSATEDDGDVVYLREDLRPLRGA